MREAGARAGWRGRHVRRIAASLVVACACAGLVSARAVPSERWAETVDALLAPAAAPPPDLSLDAAALADDGRSSFNGRWRHPLGQYALDDLRTPPEPDGIVFIGSSSINHWSDLPTSFPGRHVVARGLSGSHLADCTRFVDRLVLPHRPHTVVVYAGDNDLADGVTPEGVRDDFATLVGRLRDALPATRIVYISIKPSVAREALLPEIRRANAEIASFARQEPGLSFVDVFTPMLDDDGRARASLFDPDGLHLNAEGYALWRATLSHHLDPG